MPVYTDNASDYVPLDADIYPMEVMEVTEEVSTYYKNDDGSDKSNVVFKFRIISGAEEGRQVYGRTSTIWSQNENCRLHHWAEQILNRKFGPGEALNTDDFVGRRCRGLVVITTRTDGSQGNKVNDVMKDKTAALVEDPF